MKFIASQELWLFKMVALLRPYTCIIMCVPYFSILALYEPTMMVSANKHTLIHGEGNIVRYLGRLLMPAYDEGDVALSSIIDQWIDFSKILIYGSKTERDSGLKLLESTLSKNNWLVGGHVSLADIVVWSSLKQADVSHISDNIVAWFKRCNNTPGFKNTVHFSK